jgi:class 3 adenylate cyclase/tetratricopeptide (TPR) repeat protein
MQCPGCQHENREGRRFCAECGAGLALACPSCGFSNEPSEKFCGGCGAPFGASAGAATASRFNSAESYTPKHLAEKIRTSKATLEGERKQVTVLFADLKGSMELLADRDPEEARKLLDPVLDRMMEAVHRYEGTVNQVMGDGIMALFGAPLAHEDHAVRACYAALRMQESLKRYADDTRRSHGVEAQIRVGLNSGEVVVRTVGSDLRMDYTAVGQTTHLAARMEQLALPGTVRLTGATLRLAEGYVEVRSLGPIPVKGLPEPIEIFELTGAGQARTRLQAAALRGLTRFVGRDTEVEHLRRVLGQAAAGRGQVVAIVGEAGVGKSRLTYEFTHSHRAQDWLILEASSVSYAKATSYGPVIDLLKGYFKIGDRDDHREMRAKVLGRVLSLDRALEPLLPPLLAVLDVPVEDAAWQILDPPERRQLTLDAVKRLLLRESQVQPLLLVFEDLHWVDGEMQALLDSLVDSLGSARLLLLVNYRPGYSHRWVSKTAYSQLWLDTLPAESTRELLAALLGPDPKLVPLTQMLVKRGNPFFLEETVRTLVEAGALAGERGAYRLTRPVEALQVPATVQTILAARIDRLPADDKQLLQTASVIGKDVPYALLAAIAEQPEEALRRGLGHLQEAEFLYETQLFPDSEYTFKHALTHEVTYSGLLQERRRALHARVVDVIETLHRNRLGEQIERLAHHAVRGDLHEKAVSYLRQAGLKAAARSAHPDALRQPGGKAAARAANQEAVALLDQALQALTHVPEGRAKLEQAIDIRLELRPPLLQLGRLRDLLQISKEAEHLGAELGDEGRLGRVYSCLLNYHYLNGEPDLAVEYGERCLRIADATQDLALQAQARCYLGLSCHTQGQYRRAELILRQNVDALALARGTAADQSAIFYVPSSGWLAFTLAELGDFHAADACADQTLRVADAAGHAYGQAIARTMAGLVWLRRGHLERAFGYLGPSLEACREKPLLDVWRPIPASLLGLTQALSGKLDEAMPLLRDGVHLSEALGINAYLALWTLNLAEGLMTAGQLDQAHETARHALDLAVSHKERGHQAWALRLLGELSAMREPPAGDEAEAYFVQALALAEPRGMRPLVAHCHLGLGTLYRRTGKCEQAQEQLTTATTMYREMDMRFWLAQAETAHESSG